MVSQSSNKNMSQIETNLVYFSAIYFFWESQSCGLSSRGPKLNSTFVNRDPGLGGKTIIHHSTFATKAWATWYFMKPKVTLETLFSNFVRDCAHQCRTGHATPEPGTPLTFNPFNQGTKVSCVILCETLPSPIDLSVRSLGKNRRQTCTTSFARLKLPGKVAHPSVPKPNASKCAEWMCQSTCQYRCQYMSIVCESEFQYCRAEWSNWNLSHLSQSTALLGSNLIQIHHSDVLYRSSQELLCSSSITTTNDQHVACIGDVCRRNMCNHLM